MDLRTYYQKIRETESSIAAPFVVVASTRTEDGGKGGVLVEVPRQVAAKMVVDGSAVLASADQAASFLRDQEAAVKAAQEAAAAAQVSVTMVPADDWKKLADDMKKLKGGARQAKE